MRRTITYISLILTLTCSCTQEEKLLIEKGAPLELEITAEDLLPADKAQTRITEGGTGGYTTSFSNDDQIGITVLKGGKIVDGMDNVPFTYNGTTGKWTATSAKLFFYDDAEYIAYYPYSTAMNGKKTTTEIIAAFTPKEDQSNYDTGYSQSYLMTATGTANATTKKLSLTFTHQMAMLELQFKRTLNGVEDNVMADAGSTLTVTSGGKNYTFNAQNTDKRYRMMLKPGASFDLSFTSYSIDGVGYTYAATSLTMPAAGKYIHYDLKHTQTQVTLNSGSYEAALGDISKVVMDGTPCKVVKQTNNTYKITIPGNNMPAAIQKMDIYIKDNLANNAECLLVSSTHVSLDTGTGTVSVPLSKGGMEGAGTSESDPYLVTTPSQLRGVGVEGTDNDNAETEYYEQTSNIDLSIYADWKPVKSGKLYDGKHYGVSNLTSTRGGIFSHNGGTIQNVHLTSGTINADGHWIGGIVNESRLNNSTVSCCSNAADVTVTYGNEHGAGGIIGAFYWASGTLVSDCKNTGNITGTLVGGIIGDTVEGSARTEYCYNEGNIYCSNEHNTGSEAVGGGIGGRSWSKVNYCYNTGTITAKVTNAKLVIATIKGTTSGTNANNWAAPTTPPIAAYGASGTCAIFGTNGWPAYSSGTGDGWTSTHWKSFSNGEHPKLIWEDQVKF